jgi:heme/copper-type cytochrome/quinol oxidase subunit 2
MRADYTVEDKKDFDGWFKDQQDATQKVFSAQREILKKKASETPTPHGAEHAPAH